MTEHELTAEVIKLCRELQLLWHHCPNASRCQGPKGFPDLVIVGERGVIFAELKSDDGHTDAYQDLWGWTLNQIDDGHSFGQQVTYRLWRPADLEMGVTIRAWLELIATGRHR